VFVYFMPKIGLHPVACEVGIIAYIMYLVLHGAV